MSKTDDSDEWQTIAHNRAVELGLAYAERDQARADLAAARAALAECRQEREDWSAYNAKKRELAALRERIETLCDLYASTDDDAVKFSKATLRALLTPNVALGDQS